MNTQLEATDGVRIGAPNPFTGLLLQPLRGNHPVWNCRLGRAATNGDSVAIFRDGGFQTVKNSRCKPRGGEEITACAGAWAWSKMSGAMYLVAALQIADAPH